MRSVSGMVLVGSLLLATLDLGAQGVFNPHGDPQSGVLRVTTVPSTRGQCLQCHPGHGDAWGPAPNPLLLFTENSNLLAYWDEGDGPCHPDRPPNYPLSERDRIPEGESDAGYFEANLGGVRILGVDRRGRWPGALVYSDPSVTPEGRFVSPHAQDTDMPIRDLHGEGACTNCHDPHGTPNTRDLLLARYEGIGGHDALGPPMEYDLCFTCHGVDGPSGMDPENRLITDFYDPAIGGENAGHRIRLSPDAALSWPSHIQEGDMLPCYDCHNPHGSQGHNGAEPNAYLLSDQRPGWSGLTDTRNDPEQCRRFCFGCHIPTDGIPGSQEVEGILMNTLPDEEAHYSTAPESCYDCHGQDYSGPGGRNVHNPGGG